MIYSLSHIFLPLIFPWSFSTITSLFKKRFPLISRKISVAATNSSDHYSPLMHQLPDHVVEKIFENLCTADRVRMMLVSKSWRRILMNDDIPIAPEAPWLILSNDSCQKPEYFLSEISFESLSEERIYRFKLPGNINNNGKVKWCCCGSSNGWLLIAVGQNLYTPGMFLWNPVSGQTKTLPPLSTLPFFHQFVDDTIESKGVGNISCLIGCMQVFPIGTVECVVAILFFIPTLLGEQHHQLALCTPHDQSWTAVGGGGEGRILYDDILFHNEKLYASCSLLLEGPIDNERNRKVGYMVHLAGGCNVEVIMYRFDVAPADIPDEFPFGVSTLKRFNIRGYLVESCLTGELLVVSTIQDLCSDINTEEDDHRAQTNGFEVRRLTGGGCLENVNGSIGEQGIYVGSYGSLSLPAYVNIVEADSINFATDDDFMIVGANMIDGVSLDKFRIVRKQGIFSVEENTIRIKSETNRPVDSGFIIGWFTPKLF